MHRLEENLFICQPCSVLRSIITVISKLKENYNVCTGGSAQLK